MTKEEMVRKAFEDAFDMLHSPGLTRWEKIALLTNILDKRMQDEDEILIRAIQTFDSYDGSGC